MRCWLHPREVDEVLELAQRDGVRQAIAVLLAVRCGLRRNEIVSIEPRDLVATRTGPTVRIRAEVAKNGKRRQTPVPNQLRDYIEAFADARELDEDEPVIGRTGKTVYRWVRGYADVLEDEHGEDWLHVDVHDLRRTWATALLEDGVLPTVVMSWGGWQSWEVFREHYIGEFSPRALERERSKVEYLEGESVDAGDVAPVVPVGSTRDREIRTD